MAFAAKVFRLRLPVARSCRYPVGPGLPPAALLFLGAGQPLLGVGAGCAAGPVVRLGVARRVDQAGDVPEVADPEGGCPAEQLRGRLPPLPRGQMVSDGAGYEGRD